MRTNNSIQKLILSLIAFFFSLTVYSQATTELTPEKALSLSYKNNSELGASEARAEAEHSLVRSKYFLENPKLGLMQENNMTQEQVEMGAMNSWTISQEMAFPTKYFLMGSAQSSRAKAYDEMSRDTRLMVRAKVLSAYYKLYALQQIHALLNAQKETLREISRVAETRRATGAVPQQDEMKAHVEQTKLESELLLHGQEMVEQEAELNSLLGVDFETKTTFPSGSELSLPKLSNSINEINEKEILENSPIIRASQKMLDEAGTETSLAHWAYAPDFMLSYRRPFSNAPSDAYTIGVEVSIPLWFFTKQTAEVSSASAKEVEAEKNLLTTKRKVGSELISLKEKVKTYEKLLKIYDSALVPQALSTLNSSRSAYGAGKVSFLELLDSEQSLYGVRIEYFEALSKFVEAVTELERISGRSISNLPM